MGTIDIDREVLRTTAAWARHAAEQTRRHVTSEYGDDVPAIMATLTPEGPYGYMIAPQFLPDGGIDLPLLTTRDEVRRGYEECWAQSRMLDWRPTLELRGAWYTLEEALTHVRMLESGRETQGECVALITATRTDTPGITGELVWPRIPRERLGRGPRADRPAVGEGQLELHDRHLAMLRAADVDGLLSLMDGSIQSPVRDYVNDTGALVRLDGLDAHRAHFQAFFATWEVLSLEVLQRSAQSWRLFAETRWTVRRRLDGRELAFHTAEIFAPAHDGRFIARIGHGTDPA
jgi:hypothetical protein